MPRARTWREILRKRVKKKYTTIRVLSVSKVPLLARRVRALDSTSARL